MLSTPVRVERKLGEGGQGEIFLARIDSGPCALKWYNEGQATASQMDILKQLVLQGPPRGMASRFVWPLDIVTAPHESSFGYIMPLVDRKRFAELGEVWGGRSAVPGLRALCKISYQTANAYRTLHLGGYCYRDISAGNILFDPRAGEVLICDNDNVGIEGSTGCQVWGTWDYMAPELVLAKASPSTQTDLHSLAVLLFQLWLWHHPFHGKFESRIRSWDIPAKRRVYGEQPLFIFDPDDPSNSLPHESDYATPRNRWAICPPSLREHFTRAFTRGLKEPGSRVREGEWQELFLQLGDNILSCPACRAENLWDEGLPQVRCWNCGGPVPIPPRLVLNVASTRRVFLLGPDAQLLERHISAAAAEERGFTLRGQVVQNPARPEVWGLKNLTGKPWRGKFPDGSLKEIPHERAVALQGGVELDMGSCTAKIIA
jgi:DNA-binding helix-hairpin-helix protein with protein kinase domain